MGKFSGYLICTDYDGTFATKGEPVPENLDAVRYFTKNGGYFTIASGRMTNFLRERNVHTLINAPAALCNGSLIYDYRSDKTLRKRVLSFSVGEFMNAVASSDYTMTDMHVFWDAENGSARYEDLEEMARLHADTKALKLLCRFPDGETADAFRDYLVTQPVSEICCISKSWTLGVEINPWDAAKGHALDYIKAYLGDVHTTIGVGNYDNDLSLLEHADIAAAPEGSLESLLPAADWILKPCVEGAICDLIEKLEKRL